MRVSISTLSPGEGQLFYLFEIKPSHHIHFLNSGECYLRVGDESRQLKHDDILELRYTKGDQQFDATPLPALRVDDLDLQAVENYARILGSSNPVDALRSRNLIDEDHHPRIATNLLFGRRPQDHLPNAHVRVILWNESERLPGSYQQIAADQRFEGTLPSR